MPDNSQWDEAARLTQKYIPGSSLVQEDKYPEDVRQAIVEAGEAHDAAEEAEAGRPAGDWSVCACRIYWSKNAEHQHIAFCSEHAKHASRFIEALKGDKLPPFIKDHVTADAVDPTGHS